MNKLISGKTSSGWYLLIFSRLLGSSLPGYVLLIFQSLMGGSIRLPKWLWLYFVAIALYCCAVLILNFNQSVLSNLLFYFGFSIPLLTVYRSMPPKILIEPGLVDWLCWLIILESVLLNTIFSEANIIKENGERTSFFGFYQRPLGICGNATMTSCVLFFLIALRMQFEVGIRKGTEILIAVGTVLLASGTGFFFYCVYILWKNASRKNLIGLCVFVSAFTILYPFLDESIDPDQFNKFKIQYIIEIAEIKRSQISDYFHESNLLGLLLGDQVFEQEHAKTSGDFAALLVLRTTGIIGFLLLFFIPILNFKVMLKMPLLGIFFVMSFAHYPGLLSPPGQILLATFFYIIGVGSKFNFPRLISNPPRQRRADLV